MVTSRPLTECEATHKTGKKSRSAFWLALHGWCGLPVWSLMFFVCLTGTVATVSEEIVWLIEPAARANPPSGDAGRLRYDAILAGVARQRPDAAVRTMAVPVKGQFALHVNVGLPGGRETTFYVNPYTGAIQGEKPSFDLRQFLRGLHGWLLVPPIGATNWGWYIVSALSVPMLGSLITGLVVYKKFWRGFIHPRLRLRSGARVFWGDLHRLIGIWSIPFVLIISVTAGWFLIQQILTDNGVHLSTDDEPPIVARADVRTGRGRADVQTISVGDAIAIARSRFPGLEPSFVALANGGYDHINLGGRSAYPLLFETASINPYTGRIAVARGVSDRTAFELVTESMRPLHTGDFAGLWLKLVYFLFGLLLTMMVFSGMMIWTKRTARATAKVLTASRTSAAVPVATTEPAE